MDEYHPTRGQRATPVKVLRARELRRDMTPEERRLWRELRTFRDRGYAFRRQQIIAGFIVDFYCHKAYLVVEVDGGIHQTQRAYDDERDRVLAGYGLRVLRISNDDVRHNLAAVVVRIQSLCANASP